jgi:hypothetical protein
MSMSELSPVQFPLPSSVAPPRRARSGADIKPMVIRAMAESHAAFQNVHQRADTLIGLLRRVSSRPPPQER